MSSPFSETRNIAATRKPHLCGFCERIIKSGENVQYEVGSFEGDFYSRYICNDCILHIGDFFGWLGEDYWCPEDFREYIITNNINHPMYTVEVECPEHGKVYADKVCWEDGLTSCPICYKDIENPEVQ